MKEEISQKELLENLYWRIKEKFNENRSLLIKNSISQNAIFVINFAFNQLHDLIINTSISNNSKIVYDESVGLIYIKTFETPNKIINTSILDKDDQILFCDDFKELTELTDELVNKFYSAIFNKLKIDIVHHLSPENYFILTHS